jgi:hypothetical protein
MRQADNAGTATAAEKREISPRPSIVGVPVREEDIEPVKAIRTIALLFRGMAILLVVLMVFQVIFAVMSTVPVSVGVLLADVVRLLIFAGLLWAGGDLAVLWVKSHYDLRALRILNARMEHLLQENAKANGRTS